MANIIEQKDQDRRDQRIGSDLVTKIVTFKPDDPGYPLDKPFDDVYRQAHPKDLKTATTKFAIAASLVEDGRYRNLQFLSDNFNPSGTVMTPETEELGGKLKMLVTATRIQKGETRSDSSEGLEAKATLERILNAHSEMIELALGGVPIEVLGQLQTIESFSSITTQEKLEELRSWTTKAMLRWYLGTLAGRTQPTELTPIDLMDRIPKQVFTNTYALRYNLLEHYIEQKLMRGITDAGLEEGLRDIEQIVIEEGDEDKKRFLEGIVSRLYDVATFPLKGGFKNKIIVKEQEKSFPSFEQRAFCYDFVNHNNRLLTAETGLGKTAAAFLAMENSDASRILIISPANGRETPLIEESTVFQNPGNVFVVNGSEDIEKALKSGKKYVVIGQQLLGRAENDSVLAEKLQNLVKVAGFDGAIIDEIQNLNNPDAYATKTVISLISTIRENYAAKDSSKDAPIIGLSATPIKTALSDLNIPMGVLYPQRYATTVGESTADRKTFSDTYLNRPDLVYIALTGERKMFRWEEASGVQKFDYETMFIEPSSFESLLYEFIGTDVATDTLNKIRLLEDAMLNPPLVKAEVRELANGKVPEVDIDAVMEVLKKVALEWKELKELESPQNAEDYLSIDILVDLGFGDIVLGCFFSNLLENGVDTLVDELTKDTQDPQLLELRKFWTYTGLSTKYKALRKEIQSSLEWKVDEEGNIYRNKVLLVSPTKVQGRTGDVRQRQIREGKEGKTRDLYASYELSSINDTKLAKLVQEWSQGLVKPEDILLLDGTTALGRGRNKLIQRWVNDPNAAILFVNLKAAYQSRDFTLATLSDELGREIRGIDQAFLHWTWYWEQFKQMGGGRTHRQGQLVPVRTKVLEAVGSIDEGKGERVRFTQLLSRIALSGIKLTAEDQEFLESKKLGRSRLSFQSIDARFLRDTLNYVRGMGEDKVDDYMNKVDSKQEKNNYLRFAEKFFDEGRDIFKTTGYNAELVAFLISKIGLTQGDIISLGAGTLLLQRMLKRGIDNVDMNSYIMEAGKKLAEQYGGRVFTQRISQLDQQFPDESYDLVDCAFTLHWSKLDAKKTPDSERVKMLIQMNRILRNNGAMILTLPDGAFDQETFERFVKVLETNFGFTVDIRYSGKTFGVSKMGSTKRLGWSVVVHKKGHIDLEGLKLSDLEFLNERREWISKVEKKKLSVVKTIDSPSPKAKVKFDRYEIVSADNKSAITITAGEEQVTTTVIETSNEDVLKDAPITPDEKPTTGIERFLRGETKKDYESFKKDLIRPLVRSTQLAWQEVEELVKHIVEEKMRQGQLPENRIQAFALILKEAKGSQLYNRGNNYGRI